jgi:hypothetical protein
MGFVGVLLYARCDGTCDPHEARLCAGSSDLKMSVCGGGTKPVSDKERRG